jgi:hypothetical protein
MYVQKIQDLFGTNKMISVALLQFLRIAKAKNMHVHTIKPRSIRADATSGSGDVDQTSPVILVTPPTPPVGKKPVTVDQPVRSAKPNTLKY